MAVDRSKDPWLLRPRNAALCLLAVIWTCLLLAGAIEQSHDVHADEKWFAGWVWFCLLAGLPTSPLTLFVIDAVSKLPPPLPLLAIWLLNASLSLAFWLVFIPAVYDWMGPEREG